MKTPFVKWRGIPILFLAHCLLGAIVALQGSKPHIIFSGLLVKLALDHIGSDNSAF